MDPFVRCMIGSFHRVYGWIVSFIHSFHLYSASSSPLLLRGAPNPARILRRSFTPKRHRQLLCLLMKDLPKVLYVAAKAGVEFTTLRSTAIDSTNEPPRLMNGHYHGDSKKLSQTVRPYVIYILCLITSY